MGRLAVDAAGVLPAGQTTRTALVDGAVGLAAGTGLVTADQAPGAASLQSTSGSVRASSAVQSQAWSLLAAHANGSLNQISRSASRPPLSVQTATKSAALPVNGQDLGGAMSKTVAPASPKEIAMSLLASYGWDSSQFSCLDAIWTRESNWDPYVANSSSGAYGIPQALPGSKMATAGSDWATNPETQIRWGLTYIRASYGSPCGAWSFWESHSWY